MIRNLNQFNVRSFGTVLPQHADSVSPFPKENVQILPLNSSAPLFCTTSETLVSGYSGTSILSVRHHADEFLHFYLDKTIRLNAGVEFALSAFTGSASAMLYSDSAPDPRGSTQVNDLRVNRRFHVDGIYTFFYQEKEQGFLFPGESHPMPELTYVDQGELHSVVDGQNFLLKQGELVIYGPNQWHMQYADAGVAPRFVTISFDVRGMELRPLLNRKFSVSQTAANLLQGMLREETHMDSYSNDIILSQLTLLLLDLLRESVQPSSRLKNANVVQNENRIICRAQQFVAEHISEKLSVPLVAAYVDVSPSYLTVLFQKNLQTSPGEYIRSIKLEQSKLMIRENSMSFTQIAAALQYSTVHHFSRQFKDKFGITPTEYAKSVR